MEGSYRVRLGDKGIGSVQLIREGLYYRVRCRCALTGENMCRLVARWGEREENMGILAPVGTEFGLDTKIAVKRLGKEPPEFLVMPCRNVIPGQFVPISPEEPFVYIDRLKNAYLARKNGQAGVIIQERGCSKSP